MIATILLVAALVLFIMTAVGIPAAGRYNLLGAGLACWVAAQLFGPMLR